MVKRCFSCYGLQNFKIDQFTYSQKQYNKKKYQRQKEIAIVDQIKKIEKILQNKRLESCALIKTAENADRSKNFRLDNQKGDKNP